MNIVFFVDSYHRKASACGICIKKVADKLAEDGHNVNVVTMITEHGQPKFEVVDGVNVYRIYQSSVCALKLFVNNKKKHKKLWNKLFAYYVRVRYLFLLWFWPLTSFLAPYRYAKVAKKKLKNNKPDVIIGTYYHLEEILASIILKKKSHNAIQISYLLDAMTDVNTPAFFKNPNISKKSIQRWIKYVLERTDIICPMTSHKPFYEGYDFSQEILEKIKYMDIPVLDLKNVKNEVGNREIKKIVYTGYSTKESGSAKYLVELMPLLQNVELHLYGVIDNEITDAIDKTNLLGKKIFFHGHVDYGTASAAQNDADFLVNFSGVNPFMVSSKIFDYMSKKKPIISFYHTENHADLYYIERYPNSIIIKETDNNHSTNAKILNDFLQRDNFLKIEDEFLREKFYTNTPAAMAEVILSSQKGFYE